jgi:hypothetical protein
VIIAGTLEMLAKERQAELERKAARKALKRSISGPR